MATAKKKTTDKKKRKGLSLAGCKTMKVKATDLRSGMLLAKPKGARVSKLTKVRAKGKSKRASSRVTMVMVHVQGGDVLTVRPTAKVDVVSC